MLLICLAASQQANAFRIVVIGDSGLWGQGLLEQDKIHSRLADILQNSLGYGPIQITNVAHSGAPLDYDPPNGQANIHGEIPWTYPTILKQCENFTNAPETVDLVLLDGGRNSVEVNNILDPCVSTNTLSELLRTHYFRGMSNLLYKVSTNFTNATVVVCNYYPIISEFSSAPFAGVFLTAVGIRCLPNHTLTVAKCRQEVVEGADHLKAAVAAINELNRQNNPHVRIVFADPRFLPQNAIFAPEPWLYGGLIQGTVFLPEDPLAVVRASLCANADPPLHLDREAICVIASGGHPNPQGAQAYADAAFAAYQGADGLVWVQFNTLFPNCFNPLLRCGTEWNSFGSLTAAVNGVPNGGMVLMRAGSTAETPRINKSCRLQAYGGPVTIGR